MRQITRIIIHHTGGSTASGAIAHLNKVNLSYHDIIDENGKLINFRPYETVAQHAGGANANSIGISVVGNFALAGARPKEKQLETLINLIRRLYERFGVLPLLHHSDVGASTCPVWDFKGFLTSALKDELAGLADWLRDFVKQAKDLGISDGSRPLDKITRVEVMGMCVKTYQALNKKK